MTLTDYFKEELKADKRLNTLTLAMSNAINWPIATLVTSSDRKKGVSSLPFQGESLKNFSRFQAPSFQGGANPKSKIQNPKLGGSIAKQLSCQAEEPKLGYQMRSWSNIAKSVYSEDRQLDIHQVKEKRKTLHYNMANPIFQSPIVLGDRTEIKPTIATSEQHKLY